MSVDLFRDAVKEAHNGRPDSARLLLQELLLGQPRHEQGWYWLSEVTDDRGEKIRALETVLTINGDNEAARARLTAVLQTPESDLSEADEHYVAAVAAYRSGQRQDAYQRLRNLVETRPDHVKAWLGLSQLSGSSAEKVVALETALSLNGHNPKAQEQLDMLRPVQSDLLALGIAYEMYGRYQSALTTYRDAFNQAEEPTIRDEARRCYRKLMLNEQAQGKLVGQDIKITSDNATLVRLALGPLIIYLLLLFIQSGLNPLNGPAVLYASALAVVVGSLLTVGTVNTPHHPFWQKILGPEGITDNPTRSLMTGLGMLLVLIPFGLLFLAALNRLTMLREALASGLN